MKVFADSADLAEVRRLATSVDGFTTNPTLMRRAGVADFEEWSRTLIAAVPDLPVSLEVVADEPGEIVRQARLLSSWGPNVFAKVPVMTSRGEPLLDAIREAAQSARVNVTAVCTAVQVREVAAALADGMPSFVSVFAGRIADNGQDPVDVVQQAVRIVEAICEHTQIIWASPRQAFDLQRAESVGCHAITLTPELLAKVRIARRAMADVSLEVVRMFHRDAVHAGYRL